MYQISRNRQAGICCCWQQFKKNAKTKMDSVLFNVVDAAKTRSKINQDHKIHPDR